MLSFPAPPDFGSADEQKRAALGYITEAWIEAVKDGLDPDRVAEAALEASLRELVALNGEERVATMLGTIIPRIERGEFSSHLTRQ
jgi:hypothetical protein